MGKDADAVAVIGMAGRFPEAPDLAAFWDNLRAGRECIHFFSDAELGAMGWDAAELRSHGYVAAAPRVSGTDLFDADFFGYTAEEAAVIDPQHRVFLEVCSQAFDDAGCDPRRTEGRIGVFAGQGVGNYLLFNLASAGKLHLAQYFGTIVSNGPDFLCSRVAYKCGLTGPCVTVQTACSTGLVAVHMACQSLLNFECDVALAGAVSLQLLPLPGHFYDGGKTIYSPDGHSRVFDEHAGGTVFGDGCGVVVLRRLEDAVAEGDTIRAVIRGSAINNSGTVSAGFHTPNARAQEAVAAEALALSGVKAESIGYLEMHGSGSLIGDAIEVSALARALRKATSATGYCGLGAVKSNVGHLGAAAGMASFCKTVLAIEHAEIPPTILVASVNPALPLDQSPFHLVLAPEPWTTPGPRRAAVNSYGIGGTNAHVILEEAPRPEPRAITAGPYMLVLSARTPAALGACAERLASHLRASDGIDMADVAFTLAMGRAEMRHRRALVCADREDAVSQLLAHGGESVPQTSAPRVVLVLADPAGRSQSACRELAQRWTTWGVRPEGLFAWGSGEAVARSLGGGAILPESSGGAPALARFEADADVTVVDAYCGEAEALAILGRLWVRGAEVAWSAVFGENRRRVPLPSYPFERTRHWIDTPAGPGRPSASVAAVAPPTVAPARPAPVPPVTALQVTLCALWREAAGVADAGIDDNFFALGGTSLQLAEIHGRLRSSVLGDLTVVDVFMNPTVRELAEQIERVRADASLAGQIRPGTPGGLYSGGAGRLTPDEVAVLRADARLAETIRPGLARSAGEPAHVLLTGATGFLGVFLLKRLIRSTRATIYCHVRAANHASALDRVRTAMQARSLWDDADAGRIVPICGDLGEPNLGISEAVRAGLAERLDTIVHNGALVNFTPPYGALRTVNVRGTEDLLGLACTGRAKAFHLVSSIGVWAGRFPVAEDDPLEEIEGLENGYTQTKWVSERLVQVAADRGLEVTIHRPPRVVGDSRTGSANLDDFVARVIKGCAELGAAPAGHFFDIQAPVDFVADAIVAIALSAGREGRQRFHIVHPKLMTWRTIFDYMAGVGIPLETLPYREWRERLIAQCQRHDNALKTLLPMFRPQDAGGFAEIPSDTDLSVLPGVPCENATAVLAPAGIQCPPIDALLLDVYFRYFFDVGFLGRPPVALGT